MKARAQSGDPVMISIVTSGVYRAAADTMHGPFSYFIPQGTPGLLNGYAPGAPDLRVAEVEYKENQTVRIEVTSKDYFPMK